MSDPFIPTGREFDEGVTGPGLERDHDEPRGLLKRLFRRGYKHAGKNLTEVELDLPESVATKRPGIRTRNADSTSVDVPATTSPERSSEVLEDLPRPSETDSTTPRSARPKAPPEAVRVAKDEEDPSSATPSIDFMASLIALSRAPDVDSISVCRAFLASDGCEPEDAPLIEWWIDCTQASLPRIPDRIEEHVVGDLVAVVTQIQSEPTPGGALQHYQHKCDAWDRFDEATKTLARKSRSYTSLAPLLDAIRNQDATAAQSHVDYDSAAWHECRSEISGAIASLEVIRDLGSRPSMSRLPRATSSLPLLDRSVLSCLCTPSSITALTTTCIEILQASEFSAKQVEVQALVARLVESGRDPRRKGDR